MPKLNTDDASLTLQLDKMEESITRANLFLKMALSFDNDLKSKGFKKGLKKSKKQISRFVKAFYAAWEEISKPYQPGSKELASILEAGAPLEEFAPALEAHADMLAKAEWRDVDHCGVENAYFYLLEELQRKFADFYIFATK